MDKEYIKKLAENPNFISGVYNYCDRWCERCPLTSRCMNFALSEEECEDTQTRDINNKAFWLKLSGIFQTTLEMLKETAKEQGIDLDSLDISQGSQELEKAREIAENHHCCRSAKAYSRIVKNWFDSAKDMFEEKADELSEQVQLDLPGFDPGGEAASLKDCVEIIRWYQHFIYVKLVRAMHGMALDRDGQAHYTAADGAEDLSEDSVEEYDANGSAKIALIAMDRSIAAWGQMSGHFPRHKDDILDILVHLDRLRRETEAAFPKARAFIRPGFD
jgi:hypothetical protein